VRDHREILDALKARDADRAGQLLGHHVRRTGEVVAGSELAVENEDAKPPRTVRAAPTRKAGL
jgi:DNA-binding GntR family transcriptional regulator